VKTEYDDVRFEQVQDVEWRCIWTSEVDGERIETPLGTVGWCHGWWFGWADGLMMSEEELRTMMPQIADFLGQLTSKGAEAFKPATQGAEE